MRQLSHENATDPHSPDWDDAKRSGMGRRGGASPGRLPGKDSVAVCVAHGMGGGPSGLAETGERSGKQEVADGMTLCRIFGS